MNVFNTEILKSKKKIFKCASKLIAKSDDYELRYYSSYMKFEGSPVVRNSKKKDVIFLEEDQPRQIIEIEKLNVNIARMEKLAYSGRYFDDKTSKNIERFLTMMYDAKYIYAKGWDNARFDKNVRQLNSFVNTQIVKKGTSRTFEIVTDKQMERPIYDMYGHELTKEERINEIQSEYRVMATSFRMLQDRKYREQRQEEVKQYESLIEDVKHQNDEKEITK